MPYQIQEHFISEHPLWVQYEQSEDFKFLDRQRNYLAPHGNKALLQAEIQISCPSLRQRMIRLLGDRIFATEDGLIRHIIYVDAACSLFKDKLRQLPLLIYRKQGKQFFPNLPAGFS